MGDSCPFRPLIFDVLDLALEQDPDSIPKSEHLRRRSWLRGRWIYRLGIDSHFLTVSW